MLPQFPKSVYDSGILYGNDPYVIIAGKIPANNYRGEMKLPLPTNSVNVLVELNSGPDVEAEQSLEVVFSGNNIKDMVRAKSVLKKTWSSRINAHVIPKGQYSTDAQFFFPDGLPDKIKQLPVAEEFHDSDIEPLILSSNRFWQRLRDLIYPSEELKQYICDLEFALESSDEANQELAYEFMANFGVPDALRMRIIETPKRKLLSLKYGLLEALEQYYYLSVEGIDIKYLSGNIVKWKKLNWLNLSHTNIQVLPNFIKELNLEYLDLSGNPLTSLGSENIVKWKKLGWLNLSNTNLQVLPNFIKELNLEYLDLSSNRLTNLEQLFTILSHNRSLKVLKMDLCMLDDLPEEACLMSGLKEMHLQYNHYLNEESIRKIKQCLPNLQIFWQDGVLWEE